VTLSDTLGRSQCKGVFPDDWSFGGGLAWSFGTIVGIVVTIRRWRFGGDRRWHCVVIRHLHHLKLPYSSIR
jgi:hypothetical protein